jgi:hypothetical protein
VLLVVDFTIPTAQVIFLGRMLPAPDAYASFHIIPIVPKPSLPLECVVGFITRFAAAQPALRGHIEATHADAITFAKCSDLRTQRSYLRVRDGYKLP